MTTLLARPCTRLWLLLVLLTFSTYAAPQAGLQGKGLIIAVLFLALIKGNIITESFMGLRRVSGFWRPLLWLYLLVIGLCICAAFLLPVQ